MDCSRPINFLDPIFDTKIKCSCIVDDYYPAENLISTNRQQLARGFMAYNVVKPPIELEFQLCCCIELICIKIWPQIDSLKSTGFELHINGNNIEAEYRKTASHFNLQEYGIQFINSSIATNTIASESNFAVIPFYPSTKNQLRKVKNVKLIIKQTTRCVPVLRRIEIWGNISKFATQEQKNHVHRAIAASVDQIESTNQGEAENKCAANPSLDVAMDNAIPEAFLDAITFEIMALPMVLPSGKTIDNTTLLKHTEHEENWGRAASDPFTGQTFTESRKPVLNAHLKAQIDAFLLKNSNVPEICSLPRTVGTLAKRRIENGEADSTAQKLRKVDTKDKSDNSKTITAAKVNASTSQVQSMPSSSFGSRLSNQSLDDVIKSVLQVGKYTSSTTKRENTLNDATCFQCTGATVNSMLYSIALCSHLICRNCLVDKNLSICKCGKAFTNIDVNKYHRKMVL